MGGRIPSCFPFPVTNRFSMACCGVSAAVQGVLGTSGKCFLWAEKERFWCSAEKLFKFNKSFCGERWPLNEINLWMFSLSGITREEAVELLKKCLEEVSHWTQALMLLRKECLFAFIPWYFPVPLVAFLAAFARRVIKALARCGIATEEKDLRAVALPLHGSHPPERKLGA